MTNVTLVEAAYHDIGESIRVEQQIKAYRQETFRGGTGPTAYSRVRANHAAQMRRAEQYSADLLSAKHTKAADTRESARTDFNIEPTSSHRPTKRHKSTSKRSTSSKQGGQKKQRLSSYLPESEVENLSSSSSDAGDGLPTSRREARYRTTRSKTFLASLDKAKKMNRKFKVLTMASTLYWRI